MTDTVSKKRRSANMRAVGNKNTTVEIRVRRIVHRLGYRFRLHRRDLPGTPDLCFPGHRKVLFVHGCFWHQHKGCKRAALPQSNADFWRTKLAGNTARDEKQAAALAEQGWRVMVVWECELKNEPQLITKLRRFLD